MNGLERDTLFVALTRPQMFAGVTYSWFVANAVVATELFLVFRSAWVLLVTSFPEDEISAPALAA